MLPSPSLSSSSIVDDDRSVPEDVNNNNPLSSSPSFNDKASHEQQQQQQQQQQDTTDNNDDNKRPTKPINDDDNTNNSKKNTCSKIENNNQSTSSPSSPLLDLVTEGLSKDDKPSSADTTASSSPQPPAETADVAPLQADSETNDNDPDGDDDDDGDNLLGLDNYNNDDDETPSGTTTTTDPQTSKMMDLVSEALLPSSEPPPKTTPIPTIRKPPPPPQPNDDPPPTDSQTAAAAVSTLPSFPTGLFQQSDSRQNTTKKESPLDILEREFDSDSSSSSDSGSDDDDEDDGVVVTPPPLDLFARFRHEHPTAAAVAATGVVPPPPRSPQLDDDDDVVVMSSSGSSSGSRRTAPPPPGDDNDSSFFDIGDHASLFTTEPITTMLSSLVTTLVNPSRWMAKDEEDEEERTRLSWQFSDDESSLAKDEEDKETEMMVMTTTTTTKERTATTTKRQRRDKKTMGKKTRRDKKAITKKRQKKSSSHNNNTQDDDDEDDDDDDDRKPLVITTTTTTSSQSSSSNPPPSQRRRIVVLSLYECNPLGLPCDNAPYWLSLIAAGVMVLLLGLIVLRRGYKGGDDYASYHALQQPQPEESNWRGRVMDDDFDRDAVYGMNHQVRGYTDTTGVSSLAEDIMEHKDNTGEEYLLRNMADLNAAYDEHPDDVPFFWHIERNGGEMMKDILARCYKLVQASDRGNIEGHYAYDKDYIEIVRRPSDPGYYLNIDTTTLSGLKRASSLSLLSKSTKPDILISPHLHPLNDLLLTPQHKGRWMTLFRHPIHRAVSLYYAKLSDENQWIDPHWRGLSLEAYAYGRHAPRNDYIRMILNKGRRPEDDETTDDVVITEDDLTRAKKLVKQKCLVGIYEKLGRSLRLFQSHFDWTLESGGGEGGDGDSGGVQCRDEAVEESERLRRRERVEVGGTAWNALVVKNKYDLRLYEYAKSLFAEQEIFNPY